MGDGRRLTTDRYFGDLDVRLDNLETALEYIADNNPTEEELTKWILETTNAQNQAGVERRFGFLETIDLLKTNSGQYTLTKQAEEFLQTGDTRIIFHGLQRNVQGFEKLLGALIEQQLSDEGFRKILARKEDFEGGAGVASRHREWLQMLNFVTETDDDRYRLTEQGRELASEIIDSSSSGITNIYLAPCASSSPQAHFEDSVANPVPEERYSEYTNRDYDRDLRVWGVTEGKISTWKNISSGDYLLFYMGDLQYQYAARVIDIDQNLELAREIWPDYAQQSAGSDDATDPYEYLIFLEEPFEIEISSKELHSYAEYDQNYPISFIPLHDRGLEAIKEEYGNIEDYLETHRSNPTVWIEKTQIADRPYKQDGQYELGKALMSPSRDKGGGKRYEAMRKADVGDFVLHLLQEQHQIVGISVIESDLIEDFEGPSTDRWTEEQQEEGGYLRWISDYEGIEPHIHIYDDLLENPDHEEKLQEIRENEDKIFYDKRLSLNQGHYFTKCPDELARLLAEESHHLRELLDEFGYEFESSIRPLPPAEPYGGIGEATEDIQTRLEQTDEIQEWPTEGVARSIVRDWTKALRRANLIEGDVSSTDRVKCEQIVHLYEGNANRLEDIAESVESGTIENSDLTAGQVVFVASLRGLQEESGVTPNLDHGKFRQLLRRVHNGRGGDDLVAPDEQPRDTETIERQLQNTGQLVFYGPPGTGKTYTAQRFARWWLNQQPGCTPSSNQLEIVTFHPSFSYEDFLEGLTAETDDGAVEYNIKDGVFKRICNRAERAYHHAQQNEDVDEPPRFVLIIDEINRGNLAQIFGETITLLEGDKRIGEEDEIEITLAHSGESFAVPPNLYVIGTMNTADRSIALVDAALRRRFRFVSFPPNYTALIDYYDDFEDLEDVRETARTEPDPHRSLVALSILALRELNDQIVDTPDLGKGKQIGHSYLMGLEDVPDVLDAWKYEILPLLEEYYFGQFDRIREELFRGSGDRLFRWEMEEISDFTADDLRRTLATLEGISLAEPETETEEDTENTLNLLLDEELVEPGDLLVFDESKVPAEADQPYDSSERFWRCEITDKTGQSNGVRWLYNDEEYSFSGLAQTILEQISEHTGPVTGPDYWRHPGFDDKRLADLRTEIQTGELAFEEQTTD